MTDAQIIGKILITGELVLKSPLLIGDGAGETSDNFKDVHVLKNQGGVPFIPGTSLCGVLREEFKNNLVLEKLFGNKDKLQSAIQIEDILLEGSEMIYRDGVRIDGVTGTVDGDGKYDYEAVERGAHGDLRILINLRGCHAKENFKSAIEEMLGKLESGIRIGALTSKGFGLATVEKLNADFYDFTKKENVIAWITDAQSTEKISSDKKISADANNFIVDAEFAFTSSFIVRDYKISEKDRQEKISAVSMKSLEDFVIPGTSLKGIFRHRAEYIFSKLNLDKKFLNDLMGIAEDEKIKSRFIVEESYINGGVTEVAHTRNKIDRFTGGTLQGTLFTTKPLYQKKSSTPTLHIHFEILGAKNSEVGLALFLLRDLWIGNVAVGGEKSIGRGTLKGISAKIKFKGTTYELGAGGKVIGGDAEKLSNFAASIKNWGDAECTA